METRKIVMTSTFYPPYHLGGDAIHVKYLAEELVRMGHEVHVLHSLDAYDLKAGGKRPEPEETGVHLHPIETGLGSSSAALTFLSGRNRAVERELANLLSKERPDWVHHHNISLLGAGILDLGSLPRIYTAHDYWLICLRSDMLYKGKEPCRKLDCTRCFIPSHRPPQLWRGKGFDDRISKIDRIIAPSHFMASTLNHWLGVEAQVLPNFSPRPERTGSPAMGDHFIFAGVLEKHKGLDVLLKAFVAAHLDSQLHILGKGSLEGMVREYEVLTQGRIKRLGFLSREELKEEMSSAICLVAPSTWDENSPLSCIEALSLGTPILVSSMGGLPELTDPPQCGVVCEPSEEALAAALKRMEVDHELRSALSQNALRRYEERHSPQQYVRSYLTLAEGLA